MIFFQKQKIISILNNENNYWIDKKINILYEKEFESSTHDFPVTERITSKDYQIGISIDINHEKVPKFFQLYPNSVKDDLLSIQLTNQTSTNYFVANSAIDNVSSIKMLDSLFILGISKNPDKDHSLLLYNGAGDIFVVYNENQLTTINDNFNETVFYDENTDTYVKGNIEKIGSIKADDPLKLHSLANRFLFDEYFAKISKQNVPFKTEIFLGKSNIEISKKVSRSELNILFSDKNSQFPQQSWTFEEAKTFIHFNQFNELMTDQEREIIHTKLRLHPLTNASLAELATK